jgi:hypothetical protein
VSAGERPVLLVLHDEGHGGWQFYDGFDVSDRSPTFTPKSEILSLDSTLAAVTDPPTGSQACRAAIGAEWVRETFTQEYAVRPNQGLHRWGMEAFRDS